MDCDCSQCPWHGNNSRCDYCAALDLSSVFFPHSCDDYKWEKWAEQEAEKDDVD